MFINITAIGEMHTVVVSGKLLHNSKLKLDSEVYNSCNQNKCSSVNDGHMRVPSWYIDAYLK